MRKLILIAGVIATVLGGLWLVQGLWIVQIPPILCMANCAPLTGPSPTWTLVGSLVTTAGVVAILYALRRPL